MGDGDHGEPLTALPLSIMLRGEEWHTFASMHHVRVSGTHNTPSAHPAVMTKAPVQVDRERHDLRAPQCAPDQHLACNNHVIMFPVEEILYLQDPKASCLGLIHSSNTISQFEHSR